MKTESAHSDDGFVYILSNPAWSGWYKVGKTAIMNRRLNTYQTGSPFRDYTLHYHRHFPNRHAAESGAHDRLRKVSQDYDGEWFHVPLDVAISVVNKLA